MRKRSVGTRMDAAYPKFPPLKFWIALEKS
jgi:hypothetical protein